MRSELSLWPEEKIWSNLPLSQIPPDPSHQPKSCLCQLCSHCPLCYLQVAWGMTCPESRTLPQQTRVWPGYLLLPWLPLLLFFPWKILHSVAEGRDKLSPKAAWCTTIFPCSNYIAITGPKHAMDAGVGKSQSNEEKWKKDNKMM